MRPKEALLAAYKKSAGQKILERKAGLGSKKKSAERRSRRQILLNEFDYCLVQLVVVHAVA